MRSQKYSLILASQSPRRAELLQHAGYSFKIMVPDERAEEIAANESCSNQCVQQYTVSLAAAKAENVFAQLSQSEARAQLVPKNSLSRAQELQNMIFEARQGNRPLMILAADTVAYCQGEILGKPIDRSDAKRMLSRMSGREHHVVTAVCLFRWPTEFRASHVSTTTMLMDRIDDGDLEQFLDSDGWQGKAGAFGFQDGLEWVHVVEGLASNVVGLPVEFIENWIIDLLTQGDPDGVD